jgi:hypothetical protein
MWHGRIGTARCTQTGYLSSMLPRLTVDEVEIEDEGAYRHIAVYGALRRHLVRRGATFAMADGEDRARLLNLAFWRPGDIAEILDEPFLAADQVMHAAWHLAVADHLGSQAQTREGLLLAESIASAFDLYLVGRLLGRAEPAAILETQVPAMRDAAEAAGLEADHFEALLERAHEAPEATFETLRALLFDVARELSAARDPDEAAEVLARHGDRPLAPLLHHYELPTWILFARAHGQPGPCDRALALDAALRDAADPIDELERRLGLT